ncbi:MAG: hypothetical protein ACO4CS_15735 [bacterium]
MANFSRLQILQNQVDCRNRLNAEAEKFRAQLQEVFSQFIGKKIYKFTDSSLSASVRKAVEPIERKAEAEGFHCWFEVLLGSVYFNVKYRYQTSSESVNYCKAEFFVAGFDRNTGLMTEESREFIKRRCDYTVEEITAARDKIAELEKQISSLKSSIAEFAPGYY